MASQEALASYITKLGHPMKEIRERSLQLLLAKVRLGWELHDELNGTRKLLEALLAWFQLHQPTLQREALELLLTTIKTISGSYIAKEFGVKKIIENLNKVKHRIQEDALHIFRDVMDTLRFLNTVESEENFNIPQLVLSENSVYICIIVWLGTLCSLNGSMEFTLKGVVKFVFTLRHLYKPKFKKSSEAIESNSGYYDLGSDRDSSRKTSISNEGVASNKGSNTFNGISVLLFPWVELSTSDLKTLTLVEDSLRLLKSTRRCCRFIRDVFLRDFPVEIFLNRPAILKTLLSIVDRQHGGHPSEALQVLYSITYLLRIRLLQLFSVDLISNSSKTSDEQEAFESSVDVELEQLKSGDIGCTPLEDTLAALRQLPAPIFALDTAYAILSTMARSIVLLEPDVKKEELDMKELDLCLNLVECLIRLLLDCVNDNFWCADHSTKTERDIAHKSCMVMRTIGDLLEKYRNSFNGDIERTHHRVAWLRLVSCAEMMLRWAKNSALPPSALVAALQVAQLDQALDLLYPELSKRVASVLLTAKSSVDQEYKSKYRELTKLFAGMEYAVQFMKRKDSSQVTKNILSSIKKSLPVLQLHQSEAYLKEIADILLYKSKFLDFDERDWSEARSIALNLMANSSERVRVNFYAMIFDMVKSVLVGDDDEQNELEKCLTLICDVGVLTEICCHGLSSNNKEIESSASQILLYLLRGRLVLSESCWWRLLASLMPVFPLLHVYAAHDTLLGKAICKSLEADIVECMGVATSEMVAGLARLLFVNCAAVQLDAAHALCRLIDDDRYLPPRESIRTSLLMNAIRKLEPQEFNIDINSSPSRTTQRTGLTQILEVLKQDVVLDDDQPQFTSYERSSIHPALEPSLRRSTLQQLAVMMRQQDLHTTFLQNDGLNLIVTILRMSLTVNDYLAFPECAVSCVSVLNSVCFTCRHSLAKIPDLPLLLIRVILVFPTNESCVLMSAQVLAMVAWSGFVLQELDSARRRIPALPLCVTQRTSLPFNTNSYWNTSPNAEHSSVEWLLSEEFWRSAVRVRWWWTYAGGLKALRTNTFTPLRSMPSLCSPTEHDIVSLRTACVVTSCTRALLALENATSHSQVTEALSLLESYTHLVPLSVVINKEFGSLPWQHSRRFLCSPPASSRDTALLISMLQFIIAYMDNVPNNDGTMSWIKSLFIGKDAAIITLLSKERLFPQQTTQDDIELTQLRIHIVKILLRCVILLEHEDDYDSHRMESLLKILLACLENVDLKNFHMLGYLNELIRCIRYVHYSRYCKLSEETLILSLRGMSGALGGCAGGAGRKGQACRLDALLTLLALLRQIQEEAIPVQRWSEVWNTEVVRAVSSCVSCERAELRATALHVMAALAHYTQMLPHLLQATSRESLSRYALDIFSQPREANAVRAAAATLLAALTSRTSPHTQVLEREIRQELKETNYVEHCLHIFVEFFNMKDVVNNYLEPNVPPSLLERESELNVRAQKSEALNVTPNPSPFNNAPPTPALVAAAADVLHNVSVYKNCSVQEWNELGLFRVLFRCASWSSGTPYEFNTVRTASCRALTAYSAHKCVRTALAATKDCLYNLLMTVTPLEEDECDSAGISARAQAFLLLSALLPEREAADCVWFELMKTHSEPFLHLLLQCLDSEESELQEASLHCLTQLFQSTAHRKHADKSKDTSCIQFLDNLKSPLEQQLNDKYCAGDSVRNDCQPEYMVEDVCKVLMRLYHNLSENQKHLSSQDDRWILVCSCLCSVLSVSGRGRLYAVHRQFPTTLQATMQAVRDRLSLQGKPADVIRNANHDPALQTLYWLLTVINCAMLECMSAKEFFAENNMAASLVKLWPWCMMNEPLRCALMNLLLTFTNDCARAWASMCTCVGGRSLMGEVCQLLAREASRPRPSALLRLSLRVLKQCAPHHHCRSIVLKSDALQCACRVRGGTAAELAAAQFCGAVSKHADGAAALLNVRPRPAQPRMLPALANAAQHARLAFLQAPDLLEVLVGALVTGGTDEAVHAARAAWALAANNHRAKLVMRSAGITTAVQSCMQRLSRLPDQASQRALELLTYTHTVLQAT